MKKDIRELVGKTLIHKTFGSVKVTQIDCISRGILETNVLSDGTKRKFILSPSFFKNVSQYPNYYHQHIKKVPFRRFKHYPKLNHTHRRKSSYQISDSEDFEFSGERNIVNHQDPRHLPEELDTSTNYSNYTCHRCGYQSLSYVDLSSCPDCGSDEFFDFEDLPF